MVGNSHYIKIKYGRIDGYQTIRGIKYVKDLIKDDASG
jgi:hypothetical protein